MVVGLAPAAHGANRTGRVFSGDLSAKFLMAALYQTGFANQPTSEHQGDGLELRDTYICAAVRCVPPVDRPTTGEQQACLPYLVSEIGILPRVKTILVLGDAAFRACLRALAHVKGGPVKGTFSHGAWYNLDAAIPRVVASYHPSPRNTNTGRLSKEEFVALLLEIRQSLSG